MYLLIMKKILLVISLIIVLAGIAYVQAIYSNQDKDSDGYVYGTKVNEEKILKDYMKREDVATMVDSVKTFYRDSMHTVLVDSLSILTASVMKKQGTTKPSDSKQVDSLQEANSSLRKRLNDANGEIKRVSQAKSEQLTKIAELFYKGEMAQLPADLTDYERAVSIKEIKAKTKQYFNLSSSAMTRISGTDK